MKSLRVLVLGDQSSSRHMVESISALGGRAIYQARHCDRAMAILRQAGGVDIVVCELKRESMEHFDILLAGAKAGLVSAVLLSTPIEPQLRRAVERISVLWNVAVLGVVGPDTPLGELEAMLTQFIRRKTSLGAFYVPFQLPTEHEVRQGLAAGQFKAWFQPKYNLINHQPYGVEALARWEHPSRGVLLPREFLSAVLAYDLIDEMFKQIFIQGLDLLLALRGGGRDVQVGFNLHASQLASFDLPGYVESALAARQLPGSAVLFEVAENGLLDMNLATMHSLVRLQRMGCALAVDDFGVGFCSLTLLCQLQFDQLKLDASVVQDLTDQSSRMMLSSSVALAKAMGMSLVIEGVSSQAIQDSVLSLGGTLAQGFHLARPMSANRLKAWLN